jgi:hypothetical protein
MLQLDVTLTGETREDMELALDEILRRVGEGDVAGRNSNGAGEYRFVVIESQAG